MIGLRPATVGDPPPLGIDPQTTEQRLEQALQVIAALEAALENQRAAYEARIEQLEARIVELVGEHFPFVLITDQYCGYRFVPAHRRQFCWAHLIRRFRGLCDFGAEAEAFGARLLDFSERLFALWHSYRDRTRNRTELRLAAAPLEVELGSLLDEGLLHSAPKVRTLCRGLHQEQRSLWTFIRRCGVEPTNNTAERVLRSAVLWRKGCFGTDSPRGSRLVERILSVVATCRLQGRNSLDFVAAACSAQRFTAPAPSLFATGA